MGSNLLCKKCGLDGEHLIWDYEYNTNTGKWRLFDGNMERPHECTPKTNVVIDPEPQEKSLVKCPKCDPLKNTSWIKRENFQQHIKVEHFGFW